MLAVWVWSTLGTSMGWVQTGANQVRSNLLNGLITTKEHYVFLVSKQPSALSLQKLMNSLAHTLFVYLCQKEVI